MKRNDLVALLLVLGPAFACVPSYEEGAVMGAGRIPDVETDSKALQRRCADGPTVRGIDVSYYQLTPDWDRVKADGVEYAFIRVSDGLRHVDRQFDRNWREAKRAGVRRGAYQFFRPNLDPIAQANLLINKMGPLEPGDLPPVIDVEATGGLSKRTVAQRVEQWINHVQAATGVAPIIYSGAYFWRDSVGSPSYSTNHHLWVAHYTTGCPLIPEPWSRFTFHQFTDSGSVDGIRGPVDINTFNGTLADLDALTTGGVPPPPPPQCDVISANGRILEETDACAELGGPSQYLRSETGGHGGGYVWTGATSSARRANFAQYTLVFDTPQTYRLEAYVGSGLGTSQQTKYEIQHADGTVVVDIDQAEAGGFVDLGVYRFDADTYTVSVGDNTGESSALRRRIAFDALRVTPDQPDVNLCAELPPAGGILDETSACAELGGPARYLRAESTGHDGGHVWTGATSSQRAVNYARWALFFGTPGQYRVEAFVRPHADASRQAKYRVTHAGGAEEVFVDQSTGDGFVELGIFNFSGGGGYGVRLDDNTGESSSLGRRLIIDAVRLTPVTDVPCAEVGPSAGVGALNIRPLPNTDRPAVAQLAAGQAADRLATVSGARVDGNADWHRVRWGTTVGYISGRYSACE